MGRKGEGDSKGVVRKDHSEKLAVQMQTADLLDAGQYEAAVRIVCEYELRQPFRRGMAANWESGIEGLSRVRAIYASKPWFLDRVSEPNLANIRLVAAMDELWGEPVKIFPDRDMAIIGCKFNLGIAARQIQFHEANKAIVDEAKRLNIPSRIEYIAAAGDCEACLAKHGRRYSYAKAPEIPSRNCRCEFGCRCTLGIVINDGIDD